MDRRTNEMSELGKGSFMFLKNHHWRDENRRIIDRDI